MHIQDFAKIIFISLTVFCLYSKKTEHTFATEMKFLNYRWQLTLTGLVLLYPFQEVIHEEFSKRNWKKNLPEKGTSKMKNQYQMFLQYFGLFV